ncbi:MAG: hypothetical protein ABR915_17230 [Thermoguttaceae bacterium]|jgi:hypothetical protein
MNSRGHLIPLAIFLTTLNVPVDGFGKPPAPSLAEQVKKAELVVVGKLDPWDTRQLVPVKPGQKGPWAFRYAVVQIQVREVLKGPAKLKEVPLRLNIGWVDRPVNESPPGIYQIESDGVWLLTREEGQYVGPCLPLKQKDEVVGHLGAAAKQDPTPTTKPSASQAPDGRPIIRLPSSPPLVKAPGSASKEGLLLSASPLRATWGKEESLDFNVGFKNIGQRGFRIPGGAAGQTTAEHFSFSFTEVAGSKQSWTFVGTMKTQSDDKDFRTYVYRDLDPGVSVTVHLTLEARGQFVQARSEQSEKTPSRDKLPVGRYAVRLIFTSPEYRRAPEEPISDWRLPLWTGQITVEAGQIEITEKAPASQPHAEKPDLTKPGTYKSGDWEYRYYTNGPAKRNPVVKGTLVFQGQEMGDPKDGSRSVLTPWGLMTWRGVGRSHGWSGWLLENDVPKSAEPPPKPDEETITQLIRQLNHDNFEVREKATKDLMAMGEAAHPLLKEMLQCPDTAIETRSRIRIILGEKPIPLVQEGQAVTDPASGVTVSITGEGKELTATKGGKTIWQVRFQQPVAQTLKLENGLLVVSPDNSAYDLATGKCIWKNR